MGSVEVGCVMSIIGACLGCSKCLHTILSYDNIVLLDVKITTYEHDFCSIKSRARKVGKRAR